MKKSTRESYAKRIQRVITYIAQNLESHLELNRLAEIAHLSPYHFHRIYVALMGETVKSTVRRLRLHRAAADLLSSDELLPVIAKKTGYNSPQAFSRAFKEFYHIAPNIYRERGGITDPIQFSSSELTQTQRNYDVEIMHSEARKVICFRHVGSYMNIENGFGYFVARLVKHNLIKRNELPQFYTIFYDDPYNTAEQDLQSDLCMITPSNFNPVEDNELHIKHTPTGRCAVLKYVGPYSEVGYAYDWLFGEWLSVNEEEPDDQPHFMESKNDPRSVPPSELETWIYLPLKQKLT